jgi:hypothetical protein
MDQRELKQYLEYNPITGIFVWKIRRNGRVRAGQQAGMIGPRGYRVITLNRKIYREHRLAWLYMYGVWPTIIDHINRNPIDNRIENLREVTRSQNQQNRTQDPRNKSGARGVVWAKNAKKWRAQIRINKKSIYLGYFDLVEDAARAYVTAAKKYHTHNPAAGNAK